LEHMFSDRATGNVLNQELFDKAYDAMDWYQAHTDVAALYCKAWREWTGLDILFQKMHSPRFYNFETDKIFMCISEANLKRAYRDVDKALLDKVARENHTSRDGVHSFYNPDYLTWPKDVRKWDGNQIGTLLDAVSEERNRDEKSIEDDPDGEFSSSFGMYEQYELIENYVNDGAVAEIVEDNCPILMELLNIHDATQPEIGA